MKLLIIRHAVALEREDFAKTKRPDSERPLSPSGREKMQRAARGLKRLWPAIDLLVSSTLTRAEQTAGILTDVYGDVNYDIWSELEPDVRPETFVSRLKRESKRAVVVVIGHNPNLPTFAEALLTGRSTAFLELKKGGVIAIDLSNGVAVGKGRLIAAYRPSDLRRLCR